MRYRQRKAPAWRCSSSSRRAAPRKGASSVWLAGWLTDILNPRSVSPERRRGLGSGGRERWVNFFVSSRSLSMTLQINFLEAMPWGTNVPPPPGGGVPLRQVPADPTATRPQPDVRGRGGRLHRATRGLAARHPDAAVPTGDE